MSRACSLANTLTARVTAAKKKDCQDSVAALYNLMEKKIRARDIMTKKVGCISLSLSLSLSLCLSLSLSLSPPPYLLAVLTRRIVCFLLFCIITVLPG